MNKIFALLFLGLSFFAFSQDALKDAKHNQPLYLLDGIIAGYDITQKIDFQNIESVSVYKSNHQNKFSEDFSAHLKYGIIDIKMKKYQEQFTKVPLHTLNSMYEMDYNSPVYIDGFLVKNNKAEIYEDAIGEIQVTSNDSTKVLNIKTLHKTPQRGGITFPPANVFPKDKKRPDYIKQIK